MTFLRKYTSKVKGVISTRRISATVLSAETQRFHFQIFSTQKHSKQTNTKKTKVQHFPISFGGELQGQGREH